MHQQESNPDDEDMVQARELLMRPNRPAADDDMVRLVATALGAVRRSRLEDAITDDELRALHDRLHASSMRYRVDRLLASLAEVLLSRGVVPEPEDYEGKWWLWWPKKGRGRCQHCGNDRVLTRYSARFGKTYRYLCQRCRKQELADDEAYLNQVTGVIQEPGESADSLFERRMNALVAQILDATPTRPNGRRHGPSEEERSQYVQELETLLAPLCWAGWDLPEAYDTDVDLQDGPMLFTELDRTGMVICIEYEISARELRLLPYEDVTGDYPDRFSMLEDVVAIPIGDDVDHAAQVVAERAGELGLLDATHLQATQDSDISTAALLTDRYREWIFEPARQYRQVPMDRLIDELGRDASFSLFYNMVVGVIAADVLPDLIPDAVALGIAAWCWRNDTAVEGWHLPSDVLMARVNIAVTRAVRPRIDPLEGIDWHGIENTLTDPTWSLPDGRVISELFGDGWDEVCDTVRHQLRTWQRLDEDLLGPEATLRLLTIAGSTSYTRHWWGQGRWGAICRQIVSDAVRAGIPLPAPYDAQGPEELVKGLADPDKLSDEVLGWLIDMPDAATRTDGPRGLRFNDAATAPIVRRFTLYPGETV